MIEHPPPPSQTVPAPSATDPAPGPRAGRRGNLDAEPSDARTGGSSSGDVEAGEPGESPKQRVDRELQELLNEVRVAIPGAEVLFAFLLGVAFTNRFDTTTTVQRAVYFGALLATACATALLIAPTAYHRLRFRGGGKEQMLFTINRLALAALLLVALAISATVYLVADILYDATAAGFIGAGLALWFIWFWFGLPLRRRGL
ncbi:MAG: DUF6328 family protein [Acidimicrobiia bacterium]